MDDQKIEDLLNLALRATPKERKESLELNVGYDTGTRTWDIIIRYSGDIEQLKEPDIIVTQLLNNYAVVTLPQERLMQFVALPQVEYVEKPKRLFFAVAQGRAVSCINSVQTGIFNLRGNGIWVACVDSGVDYTHPDFCNPDGTTRIIRLWDQTIEGKPPQGYFIGTEYTEEEINQALQAPNAAERNAIVPSRDISGHGTAVLGAAAGNGRASQGVQRGVASLSKIVVVKLGNPKAASFPRTTELMQAIDYVVRLSFEHRMPVAINLSFGNSYGSHSGDSLLETYIDSVAGIGRSVICVGTGNDGGSGRHTSGILKEGKEHIVQFGIGAYETSVNLQIWKQYEDAVNVALVHPNGQVLGPIQQMQEPQRMRMLNTEILLYYGTPSPHSTSQEIYIDFLPLDNYVDSGTWSVRFMPGRIIRGNYNMWLPGGNVLNELTRFYEPTPTTTLTIPSTASRVIAVGAYDSRLLSYASFSGRGYTRVTNQIRPTLVAPGVNIMTTKSGGGYQSMTGTSFATPFVTGAAALLMEWGIVNKNDNYLYGEKVKAYLIRGARHLPSETIYPNPKLGYGALCVRDSIPI